MSIVDRSKYSEIKNEHQPIRKAWPLVMLGVVAGLIAISAVFIESTGAQPYQVTPRQRATISTTHQQQQMMQQYGRPQQNPTISQTRMRRPYGTATYSGYKQQQAQQQAAQQRALQLQQQNAMQQQLQQRRQVCLGSCMSIYDAGARSMCQSHC